MITKRVGYIVEVLEDGQIQVKQITHIMEDNVELTKIYHRHVLIPGANLNSEDARVKAVAQVVHTPQVIADFKAAELLRNRQNA